MTKDKKYGIKSKIKKTNYMRQNQNIKEILNNYLEKNEVVYQVCGELIEVSNNENSGNRKALIGYFRNASNVTLYEKGALFIHDVFNTLDEWSTVDDVLFLLESVGVLLCIPRRIAMEEGMIIE